MRIISGEFRGRRIRSPEGSGTRPMLDRVREAMFSTLAPWLGEGRVLDLFAGSGSLGLEAASRGAASVRMIEAEGPVADLLAENIRVLGVADRVTLVRGDAFYRDHWGDEGSLDIVFFDPPYPMLDRPGSRKRLLRALADLVERMLAPAGVVVFHAPRGKVDADELLELRSGSDAETTLATERVYGTNSLWYLQREEEA